MPFAVVVRLQLRWPMVTHSVLSVVALMPLPPPAPVVIEPKLAVTGPGALSTAPWAPAPVVAMLPVVTVAPHAPAPSDTHSAGSMKRSSALPVAVGVSAAGPVDWMLPTVARTGPAERMKTPPEPRRWR